MKKITFIVLTAFCSSILFSSCGVIFGGSKFMATVNVKDHPNASIYVDGSKIGTGTGTTLYSRNRPLAIEVKQEGCESKTQTFDKTFRTGNFILTVISWGLIGVAVDLGTGASFKPDHKHNPAIIKMTEKNYSFTVDYSDCKR